MSYDVKFTVEELVSTRSGNYAQYTSKRGSTTLTKNFGYQVGDEVEMWGHDGYYPERIDVNGKTIWNEVDKKAAWGKADPNFRNRQNPYL